MIKYRRTDKIGGDETAPYDVIFDREYTVREFIEYILTRNEWGNIRFIGGSSYGYRQDQLYIRFQIDIWKRASRLLKLLAVGQIWII